MKKFYIIFFISFLVLSVLLYYSSWWFLGGVAIIVLITTYQFYHARFSAVTGTVEALELQVEELQKQLDRSLAKEEKAAQEVIQVREHKKQLLKSLSHEIRTPMNAVLSMSLLMKDTIMTSEQTEYIETIKNSGETLVSAMDEILFNDVVEYAKIECRDNKTDTIDFDLRDSVEEVVNMFVTPATKKGIELLIDIDDTVPCQLCGDNRRLREILLNLVDNGVKATQQGHVLICARSLNREDEASVIRLEVTDTGTGMTEEQLKDLFFALPTRGFQKPKETKRGLIVSNKHAKQMGGKIEVTSAPGSGSTFSFTVRFVLSKEKFRQTEQQASLQILRAKNVLVVDDNATSRNIIIKQLKAWKMNTTGTSTATHAIDILANNQNFDLVLIDRSMPHMDGLQFARIAKRSYPALPIVLLNSGRNDFHKHDQDLFAGIFIKPLRQKIFRDNLSALFGQYPNKSEIDQGNIASSFASGCPLKILVAEDNAVNQKIAIKILGRLGYMVQIANNGKEAIEILENEPHDIILMDVQMPEMDGLEATKYIRARMRMQPIIIALTANVLQGDHDACIQAGMNDYISKPIELDELTSKLHKWFIVINQNSSPSFTPL